jgi:predicted Zn-ribbon and HTH transcriptional regulator
MSKPDVRRRLGVLVGGKHLDIQVPRWVRERIRTGLDADDPSEVLRVIYQVAMNIEQAINAFVSMVKKRALEMGIHIIVFRSSCKAKRCGTCRGLYRTHYPKWQVWANGEIVHVKAREEVEFLRQFVSEDDLRDYYLLVELRQVVLGIFNYTQAWWEKFGLIPVAQKEVEANEFGSA